MFLKDNLERVRFLKGSFRKGVRRSIKKISIREGKGRVKEKRRGKERVKK